MWRDVFAWKICNFAMQKVASERYGKFIMLAIQYGLLRIAQDEGDIKGYEDIFMPDEHQRLSMLGGFLKKDEGLILNSGSRIVFIENGKYTIQDLTQSEPDI